MASGELPAVGPIRIESSRSGSSSPTVKSEEGAVGERLAARIAQLSGEITADSSEFVERAPIDRFTLPRTPPMSSAFCGSRSATSEA